MAKAPALPKVVFVQWAGIDSLRDPPYLTAEETAGESLEVGQTQITGRYQLVETLRISNDVKIVGKPVPKQKSRKRK